LYDPREFGRMRNRVLLISAVAWVFLFAGTQFSAGVESSVAAASESHSHHDSSASLLKMNPPASWAIEWLLMLAAMMAPTLITPLWYISVRNFARRRLRSYALFVFGYAAVWMTVGALVLCPMLLPLGHVAAMAAVSTLVFSERLERPTPPGWRFRGLGKATRIVLAQTARLCKGLRLVAEQKD